MRSYQAACAAICALAWALAACGGEQSQAGSDEGETRSAAPAPPPAREQVPGQNEEPLAFACLVMTEAHFLNNGYIWSDADIMFVEIRNPATGKSLRIRGLDFKQQSGGKSPKEAAEALMERLKAELGEPPPSNPNAPRLPKPIWGGTESVQLKHYPEIWKGMRREAMAAAPERIAARDPEASRELRSAVMDALMAFGENDAFTLEMIDSYQKATGEILLVSESGGSGAGFTTYTRAEAEQYADSGLQGAAKVWDTNREQAIKSAKSALRLRRALHGDGHPKVVQIEKMLEAASAQQAAPPN